MRRLLFEWPPAEPSVEFPQDLNFVIDVFPEDPTCPTQDSITAPNEPPSESSESFDV